MKPLPCLADLTLEVITPTHPRWNEAIKLVDERYQQAFDAHLTAYMPAYLALLDKQVMKSVCGYRIAEQEPLFLEQYLDEPADRLLAQRFACPIPRGKLIEFGHLASFGRGLSAFHFRLMAQQLVAMGFEWCIFYRNRSSACPDASFWPATRLDCPSFSSSYSQCLSNLGNLLSAPSAYFGGQFSAWLRPSQSITP